MPLQERRRCSANPGPWRAEDQSGSEQFHLNLKDNTQSNHQGYQQDTLGALVHGRLLFAGRKMRVQSHAEVVLGMRNRLRKTRVSTRKCRCSKAFGLLRRSHIQALVHTVGKLRKQMRLRQLDIIDRHDAFHGPRTGSEARKPRPSRI